MGSMLRQDDPKNVETFKGLLKAGIATVVFIGIVVVVSIVYGLFSEGNDESDRGSSQDLNTTSQLRSESSASADSLTLTNAAKELAMNSILGYSGVHDAAISQEGDDLSLVIIVGCAITVNDAKDLGENFVRLVKTFGPESAPTGSEIGRGNFDYLVGVYCGNERKIVQGAKVKTSARINW